MPKQVLTAASIEKLPTPNAGQVEHFDDAKPGLAVRVTAKGTKSYVYFYRFDGKLRRETLGRHAKLTDQEAEETVARKVWGRSCRLSLAAAHRMADHISNQAASGIDPRIERDKAKDQNQDAQGDTYAPAVEEFIQKHAIAKKQNRTWRDQRRILLNVDKRWCNCPVSAITLRDLNGALDAKMMSDRPYAANRAHAALSTFYRWLYSRGRVPENLMEKVQKPFDKEKSRVRAWSDDELKAIWSAADELGEFIGLYLRLLVLMGQRRGEVSGMQWSELDLDAAVWTLPHDRHKAGHKSGRSHRFPLPSLAIRILNGIPEVKGSPFVFPGSGTRDHQPCPMTIGSKVQRRIQKASGVKDFTFHDARRTFRTGLDALKIPPHIKDECLNHSRRGVGDQHYSQYDYLDEQREAFEAWAGHIESLVHPEGVVGLRG